MKYNIDMYKNEYIVKKIHIFYIFSFGSMKMILHTAFILSVLATSSVAYFAREGYIIVVEPQEKTCFSKTFTDSVKVIFEFRVTAGGNQDIDAKIITPNGLVIYKEEKSTGDEVSFNAQNGDFKFCFRYR